MGPPFLCQVLCFSHTAKRASPFTTYNFDQHETPTTDLDDAKAPVESPDARLTSVQSCSFVSPPPAATSSLLHVQGSIGCLTGTLPTFTFIPNNQYQLLQQLQVKYTRDDMNETG